MGWSGTIFGRTKTKKPATGSPKPGLRFSAGRPTRLTFIRLEKRWSKVKAFLRRVQARSQAALFEAIGRARQTVTAQDALNGFASGAYSFI